MATTPATKRKRVDGQVTGLAGELFVAAELLRRDIQTSITFGNAKAIDLMAYNPRTERTFTIQVKALRMNSAFPISHEKVKRNHIYVFVRLRVPGEPVEYYVVPGKLLWEKPKQFGPWFSERKSFPGINLKYLRQHQDRWDHFDGP